MLVPILGANYADYIHGCHQPQASYDDGTHERLHAMLDRLTADWENLDVARQHFTTAFMKEELATPSRSLLYVGIVAVSMPIVLLVQLTAYTGSSPPVSGLLVVTIFTGAFGLAPLAFLTAFILRIATVAQCIVSITPFKA